MKKKDTRRDLRINLRVNPSVYFPLLIIAFFNAINVFDQDVQIRVMSFNIRYDNPEDEPHSVLTKTENGLSDVCQLINSSKACNEWAFNGFGTENDPQRIDMVFFKGRWEVSSYEVVKIKDGEMFISDHWPVSAELTIKFQ